MVIGSDSATSTLRDHLSKYVDITSTPPQDFLGQLIPFAESQADKDYLKKLSESDEEYLNWKKNDPGLADLFYLLQFFEN